MIGKKNRVFLYRQRWKKLLLRVLTFTLCPEGWLKISSRRSGPYRLLSVGENEVVMLPDDKKCTRAVSHADANGVLNRIKMRTAFWSSGHRDYTLEKYQTLEGHFVAVLVTAQVKIIVITNQNHTNKPNVSQGRVERQRGKKTRWVKERCWKW